MNDLPRLFHIGMQRSGSSYLFNLLNQHPEVSLCPDQEIGFFLNDYDKGNDFYLRHFPDNANVKIDTSPKYFLGGRKVVPRLLETYEHEHRLKFLLLLRNPVDYLRSHFQFHWRSGFFENNRDKYPELPDTENIVAFCKRYPAYLERGKYAQLLQNHWFNNFRREQFKIIVFEKFIQQTEETIEEILNFFELEKFPLKTTFKSRNATLRFPFLYSLRNLIVKFPNLKKFLVKNPLFNYVYKHFLTTTNQNQLTEREREWLKNKFSGEVSKLKELLNQDISEWRDFN